MSKLGDHVKDTISGFAGVVTGRTEYITGCPRVFVEPEAIGSDGKPVEGVWFDEPRVQSVKKAEKSSGFKPQE